MEAARETRKRKRESGKFFFNANRISSNQSPRPTDRCDVSINNQHGVPNGPRPARCSPEKSYFPLVVSRKGQNVGGARGDGSDAARKVLILCTRHSIRNHDFGTPSPSSPCKGSMHLVGEWGRGGTVRRTREGRQAAGKVKIKSPLVCLMKCPFLFGPFFCFALLSADPLPLRQCEPQ